jgi:hypothetical protein
VIGATRGNRVTRSLSPVAYNGHMPMQRMQRSRVALVVCATICSTIAIGACGSSNRPTQTADGSDPSASLVKFSACMRSHGVPDFPDPSTTETPNSFGIDGYNFNLPANLSLQSPAYVAANQVCSNIIGGGGGGPARNPAFAARAKRSGLAHAVCMRQHGVPNFPDPIIHISGAGVTATSGGRGLDPQSPAFQRAQKICGPS